MALLVLCDPSYRGTLWCDEKIRGLQEKVARRRDKLQIFTDTDEFEAVAKKLDEDSSVFVLFDYIPYIQQIAPVLAKLRAHIILLGTAGNIRLPFSYSCVSPDMDYCARTIVDYLYTHGKTRIAHIAVSQSSWSDMGRADVIARYLPSDNYRVFYIDKDMEKNYGEFLAEREKFDAVLCSTDHVAISLMEYLRKHDTNDSDLFLITYGDTVLARLYSRGVTSFTVNYYDCGKAAAKLHYDRLKHGWSAVTILLKNQMTVRDSTSNAPYTASHSLPMPLDADPLIKPNSFQLITRNIGQLSRLLTVCDIADLRLIYCMLQGYSYEKMSEFCFLSVEAVKYRLRKFRDALGFESRAETTEFIRSYVQDGKLLAMIEEMK